MKSSKLRITLRRSPIGYEKSQGLTLRALGLRHLHQTVEKADTPAIRGMINKVVHLVTVETVNNKEGATGK
ncbi:MAG TPA: 50S ribosomal protein L30 [Chthonomonas sp.]|jgi:large subunit ribosomal protein L30|uniref:50S ribosomal protein L30 n=1 Tax=Chthonomonas sp. TaxID=2282153 RepID=UPI002B4B5D1A|nr:50S ribosomal protein L30 [Chthonomonas sp.]HLH81051.1 50S ribosomal protein L30 [Chthonomonas sp.]